MSKGIARIEYNTWGNAHPKNRYWYAVLPNGEVLDYNQKDILKRECEEEGYDWQVLRHHRGKRRGEVTIMEQSPRSDKG